MATMTKTLNQLRKEMVVAVLAFIGEAEVTEKKTADVVRKVKYILGHLDRGEMGLARNQAGWLHDWRGEGLGSSDMYSSPTREVMRRLGGAARQMEDALRAITPR